MKRATRKLFGPNTIGLMLIFAGILSMGAAAQVPNAKHVKELRAIYPKLDAALKAKDLKKLTVHYDQNYTLLSDGKTLDRTGAIDQWRSVLGFIRTVEKLQTRIDKISMVDGKYLVEYSQSSSGRVQFPDSPLLPFTYDSKVTDSWKRDKRGVWGTVSSVEHKADFKVNGQSARPPN